MHAFLESLEEERRRTFRRFVAISAAVHVGALVLLLIAPTPRIRTELPAVVRVDLVAASAPPSPGPPAAKPAPPKPAPAPRPRPPEKVVIPEKPQPKPEPKPAAKPEPKPTPKPAAKPEPTPAEPAAEPQVGYEDLLADLRAQEQAEGGGAVGAEAGTRSGPPGGPGIRVSPEVMAWMRRAKMHVTRAWVLAPGFRAQPLQAHIEVELGAGGEVRGTRVVRGSGNPWFDESAERAIQKASPLPEPPEPGTWAFVFEPGDVL